MSTERKYSYKIFDRSGATLQGNLEVEKVSSKIGFSHEMNGGQSELRIKYEDDWDNPPSFFEIANIIRVYEISYDEGVQTERLVYTGSIEQIVPTLTRNFQHIEIVCLSLASMLSYAFYQEAGPDFSPAHSGDDVAVVFKAIIDSFNTLHGSLLSYTGSSIPDTGNVLTYTFERLNHREALDKAFEFAPEDYFWRVDPSGLVTLQEKPAAATHLFVVGRDVVEARAIKSGEEIRNGLLLVTGLGTPEQFYDDATSESAYGPRQELQTDTSLTDQTSADNAGNSFIEDNKNPRSAPELVIGSAFDFGKLKPGETCQVLNYKKDSQIFGANMMINRVDFFQDSARLYLDTQKDTIGKAFIEGVKAIK